MDRLKFDTFKKIQSELKHYHDSVREVELIRYDIIHATGDTDENIGGGRSNLPSNPTAQKTATLLEHKRLKQLERYIHAIERVFEQLDADKKNLIQHRYWARPQILNWEGVALRLHVSPRTAKHWNRLIICLIAEQLGER